ncbi:MAG: V-type ATP synthase subunit B, partial [Treponema sp.]|nr:V-type ATP synthase subunit B [Treponema sp.]
MRGIEYRGLIRIEGPVVITERSRNVGFNEVVAVYDREEGKRLGRVVDMSGDWTAIQIFGSTTGLSADDARVEFLGKPMELRVGTGLLGRIFNGLGEPIDGYGDIFSSSTRDVNGLPINPYARTYPRDFIQTGISAIDGMNTLIRGQKLPIFSGSGLP